MLYELKQKNPDKLFYSVGHRQYCPNMKKITLEKIVNCLENMMPTVEINEEKNRRQRALVKDAGTGKVEVWMWKKN